MWGLPPTLVVYIWWGISFDHVQLIAIWSSFTNETDPTPWLEIQFKQDTSFHLNSMRFLIIDSIVGQILSTVGRTTSKPGQDFWSNPHVFVVLLSFASTGLAEGHPHHTRIGIWPELTKRIGVRMHGNSSTQFGSSSNLVPVCMRQSTFASFTTTTTEHIALHCNPISHEPENHLFISRFKRTNELKIKGVWTGPSLRHTVEAVTELRHKLDPRPSKKLWKVQVYFGLKVTAPNWQWRHGPVTYVLSINVYVLRCKCDVKARQYSLHCQRTQTW